MIIFIASFLFSYALIPQVYVGFKKKKGYINLQTSIINSIGMYAVAVCFFTLNLLFSAILAITTATLWGVLAFQKIIYK
jgi:hypothetical protein